MQSEKTAILTESWVASSSEDRACTSRLMSQTEQEMSQERRWNRLGLCQAFFSTGWGGTLLTSDIEYVRRKFGGTSGRGHYMELWREGETRFEECRINLHEGMLQTKI
jgi:hypothetical protein